MFRVGTFNDVHGKNEHNTPDVFSTTPNRFLFTYYSLTVSVENALVKRATHPITAHRLLHNELHAIKKFQFSIITQRYVFPTKTGGHYNTTIVVAERALMMT